MKNAFILIKMISKTQIYVYKLNKNIKQNHSVFKLLTYFYEISPSEKNEHIMILDNEKFYIYSEVNTLTDNKCINKKISKTYIETPEYDLSTVEFMSIDLNIDNKSYKIKLKSDLYNFYIVDNILDKNFFVYYLITHYNIKVDDIISKKMYLKIIDNNVNEIELDINKEFIQILKDNFLIVVS
jgi:hypothetical protein